MRFCIATIAFWQAVGFDTEYWRTSTDGTKAMCHDKFAQTLVDIDKNPNVETFDIDSEAFQRVIEDEFTEEVEDE
ncbi:hypothetical protein [Planococcus beigongshangi]|uniref:hypothetical protein n=1 Tax=Planococcus beigongshangi TaxID=2782536 RepID=UPI00193BABDB|nr:hypothetical protein [Planococcus beigongshangi]